MGRTHRQDRALTSPKTATHASRTMEHVPSVELPKSATFILGVDTAELWLNVLSSSHLQVRHDTHPGAEHGKERDRDRDRASKREFVSIGLQLMRCDAREAKEGVGDTTHHTTKHQVADLDAGTVSSSSPFEAQEGERPGSGPTNIDREDVTRLAHHCANHLPRNVHTACELVRGKNVQVRGSAKQLNQARTHIRRRCK